MASCPILDPDIFDIINFLVVHAVPYYRLTTSGEEEQIGNILPKSYEKIILA